MDFENMMATPVMYRDIASSFMMNPMPIMPMYGMTPYYGVTPMQPALSNDKFEKINDKEKETKHSLINALLIGGIITTAAVIFGKIFKVPKLKMPNFITNLKPKLKNSLIAAKNTISNGLTSAKNGIKNGWNKLKARIKKP